MFFQLTNPVRDIEKAETKLNPPFQGNAFLAYRWARKRIADMDSSHRTTHKLVSTLIRIDTPTVCHSNFPIGIPYYAEYIVCGRAPELKDKAKTQPVSNLIAQ